MLKKSLLVLGTLATLAGAVPQAQAQSYERRASCDDYARHAAWRGGDGSGVAAGAIGGAVAGGILGAVIGNGHGRAVGNGMLLGGVTGGVLGAANDQGHFDRGAYDDAYWRCMNRGRFSDYNGYNDAPPPRYRQPVYDRRPDVSDSDVRYCMSRYRSYNPSTGMFLSYSGEYLPCP